MAVQAVAALIRLNALIRSPVVVKVSKQLFNVVKLKLKVAELLLPVVGTLFAAETIRNSFGLNPRGRDKLDFLEQLDFLAGRTFSGPIQARKRKIGKGRVRAHTRTVNGKLVHVKAHTRST